MKTSVAIPMIAISIVAGFVAGSYFAKPSDDGRRFSSTPFKHIIHDEAVTYAQDYMPDVAIQPSTAFMLTNDMINALAYINDSLRTLGLAESGVRVYFASSNGSSDQYNNFIAIGVDAAGVDIPSTNNYNLSAPKSDQNTIDPCPRMCDTQSPFYH